MKADFTFIQNAVSSIHASQTSTPSSSSQDRHSPGDSLLTQELKEKPSALDVALEEERVQELRRINQDLVLVNEMFKYASMLIFRLTLPRDMAELIRAQDAPIQQIVEATERSHERVQEGLRQIQIAADNQATWCAVS